MAVEERDPVTGRYTTGHDWNGITELETPIPKVVIWFIIVTHLFAVIWWVLMPTWPLITDYTRGILGSDQRIDVERSLAEAKAQRSVWTSKIATLDWKQIQADEALMTDVRQAGHQLFGDNCAVCHGADAKGGHGYPNLTDNDWLWGGEPETIAETLRTGVNSTAADTRVSQMPAFGRDGILDRGQVSDVALYVRSLSDPAASTADNIDKVKNGKQLFADNCVACHGDDAKGNLDTGSPNLTDQHWLYGGDLSTIIETIHGGRTGHMPTWEVRLSPVEIKILALYVADLKETASEASE